MLLMVTHSILKGGKHHFVRIHVFRYCTVSPIFPLIEPFPSIATNNVTLSVCTSCLCTTLRITSSKLPCANHPVKCIGEKLNLASSTPSSSPFPSKPRLKLVGLLGGLTHLAAHGRREPITIESVTGSALVMARCGASDHGFEAASQTPSVEDRSIPTTILASQTAFPCCTAQPRTSTMQVFPSFPALPPLCVLCLP